MTKVFGVFCALLFLSGTLGTLEALLPARVQRRFRAGFRTDVIWWFFTPILAKPLSQLGIFLAVAPLALLLGLPLDASLADGHGPIATLPWVVQFAMILICGGLVGYWTHRALHSRWLWPIHAVHHSSTELDWLSSVRVHPLNDAIGKIPRVLVLVPLGFDLTALAAYVPFLTFYAIFLHANTRIHYPAPLKWLLVSPRFHRWHHARQDGSCNYGGLFPVWDLLFGTFHLPDADPGSFGVEDPVPTGFFGQLLWPLRRSAYAAPPRRTSGPRPRRPAIGDATVARVD